MKKTFLITILIMMVFTVTALTGDTGKKTFNKCEADFDF